MNAYANGLKYISADSHVDEDDDFLRRVPEQYRHRLPHREVRNGGVYSIIEGRKPRRVDIAESRISDDDKNRQFREDPSGGRDIPRRLQDQRRDNVAAEVIYCNSLLGLMASPDGEFQMAAARAYNDWIHDLFSSRPDRFAPAAIPSHHQRP